MQLRHAVALAMLIMVTDGCFSWWHTAVLIRACAIYQGNDGDEHGNEYNRLAAVLRTLRMVSASTHACM